MRTDLGFAPLIRPDGRSSVGAIARRFSKRSRLSALAAYPELVAVAAAFIATYHLTTVKEVAQYLEAQATSLRGDLPRADLFGRSAFNRYYYSVFFLTREMLTDFDQRWKSTPHADVPNILKGRVRGSLQKFKRKASTLGDTESVAICSNALQSIDDLAAILRQGYSVRVTADYDPTISIVFGEDQAQFSLGTTSVTTAKRWVERAGFLTGNVRRAWKLANEP